MSWYVTLVGVDFQQVIMSYLYLDWLYMFCYLYIYIFQIKQEYSRIQGAGQPEKGITIIRKILESAAKPDLGE